MSSFPFALQQKDNAISCNYPANVGPQQKAGNRNIVTQPD
jgi:hypothetical protein